MATSGGRGPCGRTTQTRRRNGRTIAMVGALLALMLLTAPAAGAHSALLGEWGFDEASGDTARDAGPHGLDGRLGAAAGPDAADPVRIPGASGGALRFDGSSFVRLPDAPELAPESFSVEAVVRGDGSPGRWSYLVSRGGRECFAGAYGLYTGTTGGVGLYVFDGSRYVVSAAARAEDVWDGAWHHVAGTFDGHRLRLYLDGRPVGRPSAAVMRIDYGSTSSSTAFGRYVGSCDLSYRGDLDLVRLWSGARSNDELADSAMRALGPTAPAAPLPLPAATGPTVVDAVAPAGPPATAPGAPARACSVALSRRTIVAGSPAAVRVRVTLRGRPVRAVRVVARRAGGRRALSSARTGASGQVRLVLHVRAPGRVRVTASMLPSCAPRIIRVARRG